MNTRWKDILKFLRIALIVLCLGMSLSACTSREECLAEAAKEIQEKHDKKINDGDDPRACFQDKVMGTIYKAMGEASLGAYGDLTNGTLSITMLGFAIWFAFRMLKHVSSLQAETTGQVWTDISRQFFVCMACGLIASNTTLVIWSLNTLVFPIFYTFLELGSDILSNVGASSRESQCVAGELVQYENASCTIGKMDLLSSGAKAFPQGPVEMMKCMICSINSRIDIGRNLFPTLRCYSLLVAALVWSMFTILKVAYVFYLVDATFRMTMMLVLWPLLIVSFAFKQTRGWAKTGFLIILNVSALMMFMGIVLAMVLLAFEQVIIDNGNLYIEGLEDTSVDVDVLALCIVLLLIAYLAMSSMKVAQAVTNGLVGGGGEAGFASHGAKIAAWAAKRIFDVCSGGVSKGAKALVGSSKLGNAAITKINSLQAKLDKISGRNMK